MRSSAAIGPNGPGPEEMRTILEVLLVGRTPLGSAVRGVAVTILLTLFWTLFFARRWPLFSVSVITALAVVAAAHLLSRRDNPASQSTVDNPDIDAGSSSGL